MNLSLIIPIFNVEDYLEECLSALLPLKDMEAEVLLIDDGSTDSSHDIAQRFVEKYPQTFFLYYKDNGGLSSARNYGLGIAKGKYIAFLDSDDVPEKDYYPRVVEYALKGDFDLVVSDLQYYYPDHSKEDLIQEGARSDVPGSLKRALFLSPLFSWNKLYKADWFKEKNIRYPLNLWYEDIPVTLSIFSQAQNIGVYPYVSIHYRQRSSSIMGSGYTPKMNDIFSIFERVYQDFKDRGCYDTFYDELEYLAIEHFLLYGAFRFLRTDHYKELMARSFAFTKEHFPNYRHNPYIKTFNFKNRLFLKCLRPWTISFWHWYLS